MKLCTKKGIALAECEKENLINVRLAAFFIIQFCI